MTGRLRDTIKMTMADQDCSMGDLTVLAPQNDPFRVDTPAGHRDGQWLRDIADDLGIADRTIHLRGLHYAVIGQAKPDGTPYTNTEKDWLWLQAKPAKAARWLGYIPFDRIVDHRNAEPVVREFSEPEPWPYMSVGIDVAIPNAADLLPEINVDDFIGVQPYKLVFYGEKSSLDDVLGPLADSRKADLYLPTGEITDTLMYGMASTGAADGRPMQVFCFSDSDPSGWQMPISISRKLQAFKALEFPDLEVDVRRVALTPDLVREYGLPSTPLKDTEKRADAWIDATGTEQTEIDALATLQPDLLDQLARHAIAPFFDAGLDRRVFEAEGRWLDAAQAAIDAEMDQDHLDRIYTEAGGRLTELRAEIDRLNSEVQISANDFAIPPIAIPDPEIDIEPDGEALFSTGWSFAEQCQRLIDSKAYRSAL